MNATHTALLAAVLAFAPSLAPAQTIGTFRWQLQSFCNVLSLAVTQNGGIFTLDGVDDQCGAATRAPVTGLATPNPNGTIEFGLTIVGTPGATPVHVAAAISLPTLGGTWRDSGGLTGNFVFTPGASSGGSPRPSGFGVNVSAIKQELQIRTPVESSVGIGLEALATGSANNPDTTTLGFRSLRNLTTGIGNTAVGALASNGATVGNYNTALGVFALRNNQVGHSNVAVGGFAGSGISAHSNIAIGFFAMVNAGAGSRNIAIGRSAFERGTGSDNIMIGDQAGSALAPDNTATNNIYIGSPGFGPDNNTIRIGDDSHVGTVIKGIATQTPANAVPVLINGGGRIGVAASSARFKTDIAPLEADARRLHDLKPVRFVYKPEYDDGSRQAQFGLIAEDVATSFPELLVRDEAGQPWTVRYHLLTPLLLAEVQRLERERKAQDDELKALRDELRALRVSIETRQR